MRRALICLLLVALAAHSTSGYDINDILSDHEAEDLLFQDPISTSGAPQALGAQRTLLQDGGGGGVYSPSPIPSPPPSPISPPKSPATSPKASPKTSPKTSPKNSPKLSPKRSPKRSPKKSPKRSPKKSPKRSPKKSPKRSPKKSPKRSPKKSPKRSPKKSPKRSPKKSPKRSPKRSPKKSPICLRTTPAQRSVVTFSVLVRHNELPTYGLARDAVAAALGVSRGDITGAPQQVVTGGFYDTWDMSIPVPGFLTCPVTLAQVEANERRYLRLHRQVKAIQYRGIVTTVVD